VRAAGPTAVAALAALAALSACSRPEPARAPAPGPSAAPAGPCKLNLFIWSEYIAPEIVKAFERKEGCKVTIDLYEDNEAMLAKLRAGGTALYDVVVPGNYVIPAMVKEGLLAELRHDRIPNLRNLDARFVDPAYDPGNRFSAAYQWGTIGIYTRRRPGQAIDESWGWLLDPRSRPGAFVLLDSLREQLGAALIARGYGVNTTDPRQLREAADLLLAARRRSAGFEGGVGGKNRVLARAVTSAIVYNGDAIKGAKADPETYFFVPREGSIIWVDSLAIPARAPHRDVAERFIDFILDPRVGAQLSDFNQYATPNRAARALVSAEDARNPAIYPSPETMEKLQFVTDLGERNRLHDEAWARVTSQ
jgi:spermidine/putrescine transport system substrate-binding protein